MTESELSKRLPPVLDEADAEAERFFAQGEAVVVDGDSLSPSSTDEGVDWEGPRPSAATPEQLERRSRFRRIVAIGLSGGVAIMISGIGAARIADSVRAGKERLAIQNARGARPVTSSSFLSAPAPAPAPSALSLVAPRAASTPELASASSSTPSPSPAGVGAPFRLMTEARALLRAGRAREGVAAARAALETDETLADAYVLLAAGLEDLGHWNEARRTFATCAERTHSAECKYFAGRR